LDIAWKLVEQSIPPWHRINAAQRYIAVISELLVDRHSTAHRLPESIIWFLGLKPRTKVHFPGYRNRSRHARVNTRLIPALSITQICKRILQVSATSTHPGKHILDPSVRFAGSTSGSSPGHTPDR
jgi:hypothetical protein